MKSMFQQKSKKKPPPRPPPPNFLKYRSKSTYSLTQTNANLIEWSPPESPKPDHSRQFGGSVSSSYSSSTSSLTSSKKSFENDSAILNFNSSTINWVNSSNNTKENTRDPVNLLKPRIIRPGPSRKPLDSPSPPNLSLPMPKIPPPKLPSGNHSIATAYGTALFDFSASQPGDLPLQVNDIVVVLHRVNQEWLYGRVCDKEGIFPANFVQMEVPLENEDQIVTALYEFTPQMAGDLPLKPGQRIKVTKEISQDWLYGECNGQVGQFPRNFVSEL